jgi:hypothetical protein
MVRVLRAMAAALVAQPGMDTATSRAHVAMGVPQLLPHVDAAAAPGLRFSVVEGGDVQALTGQVRRSASRG